MGTVTVRSQATKARALRVGLAKPEILGLICIEVHSTREVLSGEGGSSKREQRWTD